jgi:hypothetical protein
VYSAVDATAIVVANAAAAAAVEMTVLLAARLAAVKATVPAVDD